MEKGPPTPPPALGLRQQGHSDTLCHMLLALPTATQSSLFHHGSAATTAQVSCQPEGAASWELQRPIPISWDVQILREKKTQTKKPQYIVFHN